MRIGWVKQNHLTGQASANSTRDYLRVLLFYTGQALVVATLVGGYCASNYKPDGTPYEHLLTVKLGVICTLFIIIFLIMVYAVRYGTHFHMIMNVKYINGTLLSNQFSIIEGVYHKSHFFYSMGQRMFFLIIPAFAWVVSCWLLVVMCPLYVFLIHQYEDISWMKKDIDALFDTKENEEGKGVQVEVELPLLPGGEKNSISIPNPNPVSLV